MVRIWDFLRKHIRLVLIPVAGGIVAYPMGFFNAIIDGVFPNKKEVSCVVGEWVSDHWPFHEPKATSGNPQLLVARLDGDDDDGTKTEAVLNAFQGQTVFVAGKTCRVLKIQGSGDTFENAAAKTGRDWLDQRKMNALIFGNVVPNSGGLNLNLHFLPPEGNFDFQPSTFLLVSITNGYDVKEAKRLQALAVSALRPKNDKQKNQLFDWLTQIAPSLPSAMTPSGIAEVQSALKKQASSFGDSLSKKGADAYRGVTTEVDHYLSDFRRHNLDRPKELPEQPHAN